MKSVLHGRDLIGSPDPLGKTSFVSICSSSQYHFLHINLCCFNFSFDLVITSACILSSCLIHIYFYICMRVMILPFPANDILTAFSCSHQSTSVTSSKENGFDIYLFQEISMMCSFSAEPLHM